MKILGIIPARYDSSRLPGKALEIIGNKPMIHLVYEQAVKSDLLSKVLVATDDHRILDYLLSNDIPAVMTSRSHRSGTDRCREAVNSLSEKYDYVVNIQGDEPFIDPGQIDTLARLCDGHTQIATLVTRITDSQELHNPNVVKVVRAYNRRALYFSRSPIPYLRDSENANWADIFTFWKHIGMYAYRSDILAKISDLPVGKLEKAESLEQLRWLENNYKILTGDTSIQTIGIDTPEDLERARKKWNNEHSSV